MVLALLYTKNLDLSPIEPFVSMRAIHVIEQSDGWTLKTPDNSFVAQFEHTLVIRKGYPVLITQL